MNRCHSVLSHPTNTSLEGCFSPTHGDADAQMQIERVCCLACEHPPGWAPSPAAPLLSLLHRNPFQPRIFRGVAGAPSAGLIANLGSLCSRCAIRRNLPPSPTAHTVELISLDK